ncbi:MAG: DUF2079 domain-containing protein, partial [Ktedonobacteraceae bacterium]|nr:DUF2079 domain-containing protein [Ktedonobacteraceae bacterium]
IGYLTLLHDAYLTHAEDFGIMDQALWNAAHGRFFHQTICNTISDTNCVGPAGVSRFAIHFEPILFVIAPLSAFIPTPKLLIVVQILVAASGALPAFWLARLRLRNEWAGVVIAALYLLYPALQLAAVDVFHAVTFTAALLLFVLYFMYTRRTACLLLFALLAMACKEEIPGVVALCGLWSLIFQYRWRSGLALIALACLWVALASAVLHSASPTGQSLLSTRYAALGQNPIDVLHTFIAHPYTLLREHVFEPTHLMYVRTLLSPTGYLAVLAPWVLCLAFPSMALNLFSSNKQMYSGLFQYNAEIVPILIFALIEALALILYGSRYVLRRLQYHGSITSFGTARSSLTIPASRWYSSLHVVLLVVVLSTALWNMCRADSARGMMPFSSGFSWPQVSAHTELAASFLQLIPPTASVSAQSELVPHLSQRKEIFLFPYQDTQVDYIFLDVTSEIYPFLSSIDYIREAKRVLLNGEYGILAARNGYLLLKKGLPSPKVSAFSAVHPSDKIDNRLILPDLPPSFCSYVDATQDEVGRPVQAIFSSTRNSSATMELIGSSVAAPGIISITAGYLSVTTYWRVTKPIETPLQMVLLMMDKDGKEHLLSSDVPAVYWCQTNTWHSGTVIRLRSNVFGLNDLSLVPGPAYLSFALVPLLQQPTRTMEVQARFSFHIVRNTAPASLAASTNAVMLAPLTLVP